MKRWVIAILLLVSGIVSAQSDNIDLVAQANDAYLKGDYVTSQTLYETLVENGVRDFRVYFNLGNAYYQSGDLGRALLNFRQAQEIWPRDADLANNLAQVRTERFDLMSDETGFSESLAALTTGMLNLSELSLIVFFIWLFWFVMVGVAIIKISWRTRMRVPLLLTGILLLLGMFLLGGRLDTAIRHPPAVVIDEVVQVRSGPGEAYLELYQLHSAAEIYVWETKNDWIQVALADGRLGWIPLQTVILLQR